MLAATARVARDIDLAEECVQDAYVAALDAWARQGVPRNPGAWLTTAARRRALDALRREPDAAPEAAAADRAGCRGRHGGAPAGSGDEMIPDDRLRLVFTCCHPALAREAQVALTLRLVCGLTTAEIAQAFLVPEPTMAARVTRAKKKISAARIAYRVPGARGTARTGSTPCSPSCTCSTPPGTPRPAAASWSAPTWSTGPSGWPGCCAQLMPDERGGPRPAGAAAAHRCPPGHPGAPDGRLLLLEDQDRSQWDRRGDRRGRRPGDRRAARRPPGRFALQAAIAALHAEAPSYASTDWRQLVRAV